MPHHNLSPPCRKGPSNRSQAATSEAKAEKAEEKAQANRASDVGACVLFCCPLHTELFVTGGVTSTLPLCLKV